MAGQGQRNSHGRAQTSLQSPRPTRGCPSVSTQCSPVGRHHRAQRLQGGAERGENRSGRWSRISTHGTQVIATWASLVLFSPLPPLPCLDLAQLPSYSQVHSVPRTGHCFSLLQKSKLLCKKQRFGNREENSLKCIHCLNKCLWGLAATRQ